MVAVDFVHRRWSPSTSLNACDRYDTPMGVEPPVAGPAPGTFDGVFTVYEVRRDGDRLLYFGDPLADQQTLMQRVWPVFRKHGFDVRLAQRTGEYVLVAEPASIGVDGIPWTNIILAVATLLSTLLAGASWYYVEDPLSPALLQALPFMFAVMGVFATHELGHYVLSRYHQVDASLPYFIPFPTLVGTMGAVIRMRGQIPDRKALFDIGVAGPLAGIVATIVVTAIGFALPPIMVPDWVLSATSTVQIQFGQPLLLRIIAVAVGEQGVLYSDALAVLTFQESVGYTSPDMAMNPVVIGGWVGMFITFLNLIPVGQLDGGHLLRAMLGPVQERIMPFVPLSLFALAAVTYYVLDAGNAAGIWVLWGFLTIGASYMGSARPIDESRLDHRRIAVGVLTFVLGALCFTPVPIAIVGG
jgi:membrane-associated protease RseP (regulator of RpoE activity)